MPVNVQNRFLALLVNLADGISQYRQIWARESGKRKRMAKDAHLECANVSKKVELMMSGISNDATEEDDTDGSVAMPGGERTYATSRTPTQWHTPPPKHSKTSPTSKEIPPALS